MKRARKLFSHKNMIKSEFHTTPLNYCKVIFDMPNLAIV